ncbi:MAG: metal-dependent hydrolase [Thermomicrobiales bacterium]
MNLTYFGHGTFGLEADGKKVLVDPFFTGNPAASTDAASVTADTILLTHAHNDHVGDTIEIAKRCDSTVIATFELANWVASQGVERTIGGNFVGTVPFAGGTAKFVPAWHTSSYSSPDGIVAAGVPAGYVVRFGGKTIYFAVDTRLFLDMQLICDEKLDVAVIPIGDYFTMGPTDAVRAAKLLQATTVIPGHFNTFPAIQQDADEWKKQVETETESKVAVLQPGQTIVL